MLCPAGGAGIRVGTARPSAGCRGAHRGRPGYPRPAPAATLWPREVSGGPAMNPPYRRIAVCVDDSEAAMDALAEAVRLSGPGAEALQIVHVVSWPPVSLRATMGVGVPDPHPTVEASRRWREAIGEELRGAERGRVLVHPAPAVWGRAA